MHSLSANQKNIFFWWQTKICSSVD
jgi:hypothetical protein